MRLTGKVALVTGGASGMGQSEATIFAREGARVVVADRLEVEGRQTVDKIVGAGGQAQFVKLDVTSETEWKTAIDATVAAFGKLDILVNNAGISGTFDQDMLSTSAWDNLMNVNAKGVFLGMKTAIPVMQKTGGGAIVNISSISGFVGQSGVHMGYNASKGAVRIMTKTAAVRRGRHPRQLRAPRLPAAHADVQDLGRSRVAGEDAQGGADEAGGPRGGGRPRGAVPGLG